MSAITPQNGPGAGLVALAAALIGVGGLGCRAGDAGSATASPAPHDITVVRTSPNLSTLAFQNQDGQTVRLADLQGKPVLMSFIFTRCTMPTMCPLTTRSFAAVQHALTAEERRKTALVLVSFDPAYDTPAVLKRYGEGFGADFAHWQFWTGAEENILDLTNAYNVWYKGENGDFAHRMVSVLLNPDGSYHGTLRGADWDVEEATRSLRGLIPGAEARSSRPPGR
jgi:protein SCO1/2